MPGLIGHSLGHYRLVEEVGRGGMATVCRAIDTRDNSEVAIKVLSPTISGDNRFVRRFKREGSLLADLKHPYIVPILGYGDSKGMAYMVMPFIRGDSLQDRLEQGKINKKERERWIQQIAEALMFAHNRGIIHRDVKPSNIMIDKSGNALLTDFGLAREVEGSNTLTGSMLLGTPAYMAPEQGRGDPVDARSDQYSFGVILYQLITGRLPFEAESPMGTVLKHIQEPVPRPTRFVPGMSPALERVILKCLAKDPEYRYPSVGAFYEAYKAARDGASVADLDLETVVVPLDPAFREHAEHYRTEPPMEEMSSGRRSRLGLLFIGLLPLMILGIVFAFPSILEAGRDLLGMAVKPTPVPTLMMTATSAPSPTAPEPTQTAVPQPITFTKSGCPDVKMYPPKIRSRSVVWILDNAMDEDVAFTIADSLGIPENNLTISKTFKILLGNKLIFEGGFEGGSLDLGEAVNQILPKSSTTEFSLEFPWAPMPTGYELHLDFGDGCHLDGNW
jgi:serine/threonine protein kinase